MELKKSVKADLEWRKPMFFQIGIFVALTIVLVSFEKIGSKEEDFEGFALNAEIVEDETIIQTEQLKETPPPPPETQMSTTVIEIVEDNLKIDNDYEFDAESDESTVTQEYEYVEQVEEEVKEEEIFIVVENNPEYPGGEDARLKFLQENIVYPRVARESGIEGRVMVGFVVEPDGRLSNVKVVRGRAQSLDEEAVRVVKMMPKWKPGKQRGRAVRVQYTMPITFVLH